MREIELVMAERSRARQKQEEARHAKRRRKILDAKVVNRVSMISNIYDKGKKKSKNTRKNIVAQPSQKKWNNSSDSFYSSEQWRRLRYAIFERDGKICACCETTRGPFHVDHIIPRSKNRLRELDPTNLQILCENCNIGKKANYSTDWRGTVKAKALK